MSDEKKKDTRPYWMQRRDSKLGAVIKPPEQAAKDKDALTVWYDLQATMAPAKCENCSCPLAATINFHPRAHICHIVPKSKINGCPSVATHPFNRWFGCVNCHKAYDEESAEIVETMPIIPVLRERLKNFFNEIKESEVRRVPFYLLPAETVIIEDPPEEIKTVAKRKKSTKSKVFKEHKVKKQNAKKQGPARDEHGKFIPKSTKPRAAKLPRGAFASRESYDGHKGK